MQENKAQIFINKVLAPHLFSQKKLDLNDKNLFAVKDLTNLAQASLELYQAKEFPEVCTMLKNLQLQQQIHQTLNGQSLKELLDNSTQETAQQTLASIFVKLMQYQANLKLLSMQSTPVDRIVEQLAKALNIEEKNLMRLNHLFSIYSPVVNQLETIQKVFTCEKNQALQEEHSKVELTSNKETSNNTNKPQPLMSQSITVPKDIIAYADKIGLACAKLQFNLKNTEKFEEIMWRELKNAKNTFNSSNHIQHELISLENTAIHLINQLQELAQGGEDVSHTLLAGLEKTVSETLENLKGNIMPVTLSNSIKALISQLEAAIPYMTKEDIESFKKYLKNQVETTDQLLNPHKLQNAQNYQTLLALFQEGKIQELKKSTAEHNQKLLLEQSQQTSPSQTSKETPVIHHSSNQFRLPGTYSESQSNTNEQEQKTAEKSFNLFDSFLNLFKSDTPKEENTNQSDNSTQEEISTNESSDSIIQKPQTVNKPSVIDFNAIKNFSFNKAPSVKSIEISSENTPIKNSPKKELKTPSLSGLNTSEILKNQQPTKMIKKLQDEKQEILNTSDISSNPSLQKPIKKSLPKNPNQLIENQPTKQPVKKSLPETPNQINQNASMPKKVLNIEPNEAQVNFANLLKNPQKLPNKKTPPNKMVKKMPEKNPNEQPTGNNPPVKFGNK